MHILVNHRKSDMAKKSNSGEFFIGKLDLPNATYSVKRKFLGKWHIRGTSEWDYDYLSMVGRPEIQISSTGYGTIRFGAFEAMLDAMKDELRPEDVMQFSFYGTDEGDEVLGRGAAWLEGDIMKGRIAFHRGMVSDFEAERDEPAEEKTAKRKRV